ncbi:putative PI31 proteasome regulator [Rosa chinensis]|uniref:Putative PI31 proteasome regulator n=1 Tax=Rosa chinensis TaxID=74649 RepID=A0A2P6QUF1_ROSCH|nr:probable proteasome inhibitor [Rosa chinensis]PRQ37812.1 putative PI31 proteasome regulator [Rosa chinensis]
MANEKSVMAVIRAARPTFRNNNDKVAFAVHASFVASGYELIATGPPAFSDSALLSSSPIDEVGIDGWNELDDEYAFVYANAENKNKLLVKCLVMNEKLFVDALASHSLHLEINVGDYVGGESGSNYSSQFKNLETLVNTLDAQLLSKLDSSSSTSNVAPVSSETSERSITEPPTRPSDPPLPSRIVYPSVNPIGDSDRFPGPGAGMYPARGDFGGGGMLLGPNDPRWFGGIREPGFPGGQPGVPPGARFDPYGPPGVPGFEPNRFARNPRRPGGGTHPDLEHFGSGSDFI